MATSFLKYKLSNGYLQNWLAAGPLVIPIPDCIPSSSEENFESSILQWYSERYSEPDSGVTEPPVDLGPLGKVTRDHPLITWRYYGCREDHYIDFTAFHPTCSYLRSWAYAQLAVQSGHEVILVLTTNGPADLWLNGQHLQCQEHFSKQLPCSVSFPAALQSGSNEILIRFENAAVRETPYVMALQVQGIAETGVEVILPTAIESELLGKRQTLEKVVENAILDRYVYGFLDGDRYNQNEPIPLRFSSDLDVSGEITFRLQSLAGDIFQEGTKSCDANTVLEMAKTFPLRNGPHHLALLPPAHEYYREMIRFERKEIFYVVRTSFAQKPFLNTSKRAKEALEDAAQRRNDSIYCEIAKIALGRWENVDRKILQIAIEGINQRRDGSVCDLLAILGALMRFRKKKFPLDDLKPHIEACITNYRYWEDETSAEGVVYDGMDFSSESRQILYHACAILAGQLLPERVFERTGKTGRWHRERGERLAITWLQQRGMYGFKEWDSPASVEAILAALSQLVDLADSGTVCELASVLMDKVFFSLAVNSFKGAYGSSRGRGDTASVLSARLEPTSGISRLMWGMGNFNENVIGTVSLACCRKYKLPDVIRKIAKDPAVAFWSQERHGLPARPARPIPGLEREQERVSTWEWEVNKVTYKTKDFMLCSAQDYDPGKKGHQEHIWQATLGPDAVVFVNHPACTSEDDAHRPNLWAGNGVLPRVAQWGDVLIAIYQLPEDDWLGFTHAYFPAAAFDEYIINGKWAFARKGRGYLALTAAQGLEFVTHGQTAFRELRSYGHENIWLCHMGQELLDGAFEDFQRKMLAVELTFEDLSMRVKSLRSDLLAFGWEGPLLVNGQGQSLSGFRHFENPYCVVDLPVTQMDIIYQGSGVRLKFD